MSRKISKKVQDPAAISDREGMQKCFEISPDLLLIADRDGRIKRLNPAWEHTLGYSTSDLEDRQILEYIHPEEREKTEALLAELVKQSQMTNFITRYRHKNGVYRWIEWYVVSTGDFICAAARDITSRRQAEEELFNSRQMLQQVMDTVPMWVFWKDRNSVYLNCNIAFARDAGFEHPSDIVGTNDFSLPWKAQAASIQANDRNVIETGVPILDLEILQEKSGGEKVWLKMDEIPVPDRNGTVVGVLGVCTDITTRKIAEEHLKHANDKLTATVNELERRNREAELVRKMDDLLHACNESEEAYTVVQQYGQLLFPFTNGAMCLINNSRRMVEAMASWGENMQSELVFAVGDCWTLRRGQVHRWNARTPGLRCHHIHPAFSGDYLDVPMLASGELLGMLHVESPDQEWFDLSRRELAQTVGEHLSLSLSNIKLREKLHEQSVRDPLTGLFNRRYMEESLERELCRATRNKTSVGIIMLDIDHFKSYNDSYGHEAGDAVLHELGTLLKNVVRSSDVSCRFGGEEFILILPDASIEIARERAEQVRNAVKYMVIEFRQQPLAPPTVSLGVAAFPLHGKQSGDLIRQADKALYRAKRNGRDRVEVADDSPY